MTLTKGDKETVPSIEELLIIAIGEETYKRLKEEENNAKNHTA